VDVELVLVNRIGEVNKI